MHLLQTVLYQSEQGGKLAEDQRLAAWLPM
jgi:hypothetical protein